MFRKIKNLYHLVQALAANIYYGWPSKKLKVIGITGTDGKTTTTSLIYHILKSAGKKTSMISTVYAKIGDKEFDTGLHTTTPHSFDIQKFLKKSVDENVEYFVLETTSHALDQNRIYGVHFEVGLITNITHEHLDYHKTYSNYVLAKAKLFSMASKILINKDDGSFEPLSKILNNQNKGYKTYGLEQKSDYSIEVADKLQVKLSEFNRYNFLSAYAVCKELGLNDEEIFNAMKTFSNPPGRMEVIYDKKFIVIVDFAHTPNAMVQLLKSVSKLYPHRRIINVFGSAGFRDATKRPSMGEASATYADMTIVTEDDPRTEGAQKIAEEIAIGLDKKGFKRVEPKELSSKTYTILTNRNEALEKAISIAKNGDVLVFSGKGHEKSIARGNHEDPWSDKDETLKLLKKLNAG